MGELAHSLHPLAPEGGQHVLVVEDDSSIRQTVAFVLDVAGYSVHEAPNGRFAMQQLHISTDRLVVVTDWLMPGMDGRQLLEAVAVQEELATRHVYILMTAFVQRLPPDFAALLAQLQVMVIAKPFDIDTLLAAVAQAATRLNP